MHLRAPSSATAALFLLATPGLGLAAPTFSSMPELYDALRTANFAIVTAYVLPEHGGMTAALSEMCRSGKRVDVQLPSSAHLVGSNVQAAVDAATQTLQDAGCKVQRVDRPLHMKLAYVGDNRGGVPYLADRNFGRNATVLRIDDPSDRNLIARTLRGQPGTNGTLATRKDAALALEAHAIDASTGTLAIETESFGENNPVFDALLRAISHNRKILLLVANREASTNPRERTILEQLRTAHVNVRTGDTNAKIMLGGNNTAWFGSTNASSIQAEYAAQVDWGRIISDQGMRAELARRFIADWTAAQPF
jgi:hypothetical protein